MSDKKVTMTQAEYYELLKLVTFMSEPFNVNDKEAFGRVQHAALAARVQLVTIGDANLLPRANPIKGDERRISELDRRRQDDFDREQIREYEKQVREENG